MQKSIKVFLTLLPLSLMSSCSLFGIQSEEGPKYKILLKDGGFEIREYVPYIVAQTTIEGDYNESSGKAFKILAGYIFGKNKGEKKIQMTGPVEIKTDTVMISMTSPVTMDQKGKSFTMSFSMPSKYSLSDLPEPIDERIKFKKIDAKILAVHRYTWFNSKERNDKKAQELKTWIQKNGEYTFNNDYTYAGYNPPWTIPFLKRNEIMIELKVGK